jgi:hypothetical protein
LSIFVLHGSRPRFGQSSDLTSDCRSGQFVKAGRSPYFASRRYSVDRAIPRRRAASVRFPPQSRTWEGIDVARRQNAKSWELRGAMSLARLWRQQGRQQDAVTLLAPVYGLSRTGRPRLSGPLAVQVEVSPTEGKKTRVGGDLGTLELQRKRRSKRCDRLLPFHLSQCPSAGPRIRTSPIKILNHNEGS